MIHYEKVRTFIVRNRIHLLVQLYINIISQGSSVGYENGDSVVQHSVSIRPTPSINIKLINKKKMFFTYIFFSSYFT